MTDPDFDARLVRGRRTIDLLAGWGLGAPDIAALLGLSPDLKPRALARFRGAVALPDEPEVNRRVEYLLRIEEALDTFFPRNPEMRQTWLKRGNRRFGPRSPLARMLEDGESGLIAVLCHLDCTFAWDLTGSRSQYQSA